MQAVRMSLRSPILVATQAMGIINIPLHSGRNEVVNIENMSLAPSIPAKRIMTALSVRVTSPRKPQHEDKVALISEELHFFELSAFINLLIHC